MKIIPVKSDCHLKQFVRLPEKLFGELADFIPPLWLDEKKDYTALHNPILAVSEFQLLLAYDDHNKPVGRLIVYIDFDYNKFYQTRIGFFGAFVCINDQKPAQLLIDSAENWLREKGCTAMRGPINPQAENWGFIFSGYERPTVFLSPSNPPYYHDFFVSAGYTKVKDLLVYEADIQSGYQLPNRYDGFQQRFAERFPGIRLRRLNLKKLEDDARAIWLISNASLQNNWGYVPLGLSVMEDMLSRLKLIVDPDAVWIAENDGQPVGFCLGFPDINIILKKINGRLLPFGWLHLLRDSKKLRDYRLFGLAVLPEWQGRALDALMYINLYEHLKSKNVRMEANYILEDNLRIRNALEKLGMQLIKSYRVYEKPLV
jgi:GNAT superfamily N-acetyltransferase